MGRAIVRDPKVFLFDEPLSNPSTCQIAARAGCGYEIKRPCSRNSAPPPLYVTHDQVEAMTLADRLVVMNAGNADQIGPPLELYERPATAFVAGFIGSPAMNLVDGRRDVSGIVVGDCVLPVDGPAGEASGGR